MSDNLPEPVPDPGFMGNALTELTAQEERFVALHCSGMGYSEAARAAGYSSTHSGFSSELAKKPAIRAAIEQFRREIREQVQFDIHTAHAMYMEAFANAGNSTEQRLVVDSLVKLHGLAQKTPTVQVNVQINQNKAAQMSDEDLLKLLGKDASYLDPDAYAIDGEFEEVEDD